MPSDYFPATTTSPPNRAKNEKDERRRKSVRSFRLACDQRPCKRYTVRASKWQTLEIRSECSNAQLSNAWCHKVVLWVNACIVYRVNPTACDGTKFAYGSSWSVWYWVWAFDELVRAADERTHISIPKSRHLHGTNWIHSKWRLTLVVIEPFRLQRDRR